MLSPHVDRTLPFFAIYMVFILEQGTKTEEIISNAHYVTNTQLSELAVIKELFE